MTYQLKSSYFCVGVIVDKTTGLVTATAPITNYIRGWSLEAVKIYARKKGWTLTKFDPVTKKEEVIT